MGDIKESTSMKIKIHNGLLECYCYNCESEFKILCNNDCICSIPLCCPYCGLNIIDPEVDHRCIKLCELTELVDGVFDKLNSRDENGESLQ